MALELRNISKSFAGQTAVKNVSLTVENGEFFSLLGASGCGKTTLMRIISGLERADSGEIFLDGVNLTDTATQLRPFNMVFQNYALFPHMTVGENIAFGLKMKKLPMPEIKNRVGEVLELINLREYENRLPETLSGGQQQRVAVARALVNKPRILLLDEPLSALDKKMREHMQSELRSIQRAAGITFLFVTHDQEEALTMSDKIAIMSKGVIKQVDSPRRLYTTPSNSFSALFFGDMNVIEVEFVSSQGSFSKYKLNENSEILIRIPKNIEASKVTKVYIRPEKLKIIFSAPHIFPINTFEAEIKSFLFKGLYYEMVIGLSNLQKMKIFVNLDAAELVEKLTLKSKVTVSFNPEDAYVFSEEDL